MDLKTTVDPFVIDDLFIGGDPPVRSITLAALGAGAEAAIGATLPRGTIVFNKPVSNNTFAPLGAGDADFNSVLLDATAVYPETSVFGILVHDTATDDDGTVECFVYTGGRFNETKLIEINDGDSFAFFDGDAMSDAQKEKIINLLIAQGFDIVPVSY